MGDTLMPGVLLVNGIESDNEDLEFDCIGAGKTIKFKRDGVEVASIGDGGISGIPGAHELCKAWVNFNGAGTVAIRDSFNVSSITDYSVGDYRINFTVAMANAAYAVAGSCKTSDSRSVGYEAASIRAHTYSTTGVEVNTDFHVMNVYYWQVDPRLINAMVFGN